MRYRVLDSWRGIAAISVAAFHFPASGLIHNLPLVRHAYFFVDFFFVLSGFVIAHAARDGFANGGSVARFMARRFGRVYPLYFVALMAFLAVELLKLFGAAALGVPTEIAPFKSEGSSDPAALALHVSLLQTFGLTHGLSWNWPDWSIAAEFWTYLIFAFLCWAVPTMRVVILCGLAVVSLAVMAPLSQTGIEVTYDFGFLRCLYGFAIGAIAYEASRAQSFRISGVMATTLEFAVVLLALVFVTFSGRGPSSFAAPLVFGATILVFANEGGAISGFLSGRFWQRLGELSYSIYIVHALIVLVFAIGVSFLQHKLGSRLWQMEIYDGVKERVISSQNWLLLDGLTLAYLTIVVLFAALSYRYIENPARRYVSDHTADMGARPSASAIA